MPARNVTSNDPSQYSFIVSRDPESFKGDYGHALLIAGSYGKMGAAVLAARACLRAGCGLLTVHTPREGVPILQTAVPEAMLSIDENSYCFSSLPRNLEVYNAIAVGPGIGTSELTSNTLLSLMKVCSGDTQSNIGEKQLILDADALNIISRHPESIDLAAQAVITPHSKEYERLFKSGDPQLMAEMHDLVIVKKAHCTKIYAPGREPVENVAGNAGMATAGSGDVLTGITLGLMSQAVAYQIRLKEENYLTQFIAALAVNVHSRAGDIAAARLSQAAMVASDIIDCIPEVYKQCQPREIDGE